MVFILSGGEKPKVALIGQAIRLCEGKETKADCELSIHLTKDA